MPIIDEADSIPDAFDAYWDKEQIDALENLIREENLSSEKTEKFIADYLFT